MIRPLGDRVLVRPTPPPEVTPSGILVVQRPDAQGDGTVVAIGSGRTLPDGTREVVDVAVGDRVLYPRFVGVDVEVDGEKLLLISQKDILVIA